MVWLRETIKRVEELTFNIFIDQGVALKPYKGMRLAHQGFYYNTGTYKSFWVPLKHSLLRNGHTSIAIMAARTSL